MFWWSKHPSLEWEVWLQKHPFARFCMVIKVIRIVHISKISPFCWAKLEEMRFLCFHIYKINCPIRAKIPLNLTSEGLKYPPEVGFEQKTCRVKDPWTGPPKAPDWFESISPVFGSFRGLKRALSEAHSRPYFDLPWPLLPTRSNFFGPKWLVQVSHI